MSTREGPERHRTRFYDPATNALIPAVVERESIQQANAVHTVGKNTAMIEALR